uniref:Tail fiber protein n=1 Tax=Salmonella phage vB_SEnST11_KE23 TaxID=3161174 RepID=A0AAU8GF06_9CAUD
MADVSFPTVKVSDLPSAVTVSGGDYVVMDQADTTRKASLDTIMTRMGIMKVVFFSEGGFLESKKDLAFFETNGKYYTWNGAYPKTIPMASAPSTTGGISENAWQEFGASGGGGSTGKVVNLGSVQGTATCDLNRGDSFVANLTGGQCVIIITNPSTAQNVSQSFTLSLTQGTGANLVSWPSNIKWNYGRVPVLSYKTGVRDIFQFVTYDGGNSWFGSLVMAGVE